MGSKRSRVFVAGIAHESNSFAPRRTVRTDFLPTVARSAAGDFAHEAVKGFTTVSGFVETALSLGLDIVPGLLVDATPGGIVDRATFETLAGQLTAELAQTAPTLAGVYLSLHGAMVVDGYESGDLELVRRVRAAVGADVPVVVTHDFHANITAEIVAETDVLITFKENPHIDTKDRGAQAATIMAGIIDGSLSPVQALCKPTMLYNIAFQHTKRAPLLPIVDETRRLETLPGILAASVAGGYQYADVPQMGPSVVVVTNGDRALAEREAQRLGDRLWATRNDTILRLPDAAGAVKQAIAAQHWPVVLMDMGDNIGGGSAGDSTFLLDELIRQGAQGWVVVLAGAAAVELAARAGVGGRFDAEVGGQTDTLHGSPVRIRGSVKSLHDGKYIEPEVRHLGVRYHDMGLCAVVEVEGSTADLPNLLVVTSKRSSPYSLHQLISLGVYPDRQRFLVVKGTIAPRAAYEPIAAEILAVDTPGATSANPGRFSYTRVRRPLFGID
jgi:microcystin degradation protein MlrC